MKILIINTGSSSLKLSLLSALVASSEDAPASLATLWEAQLSWSDPASQELKIQAAGKPRLSRPIAADSFRTAMKTALVSLWEGDATALSDPSEVSLVGHRVVHGGTSYCAPTVITREILGDLRGLIPLAPSHEPVNIEGIEIAQSIFTSVPHVAVFDTAFHHTIPDYAAIYAGPYQWFQDLGIRRFGFHGISHEYCARRAIELSGLHPGEARVITCHLGSGASLSAVKDGTSLMNTMGFTPSDGLIMATRSGSMDPGLLLHLLQINLYTTQELCEVINQQSGLKGLSGISGDMRELEGWIERGHSGAQLAFDAYIHSLVSHIASLLPVLGGIDILAFTGGVGENSSAVRSKACQRLEFAGIQIDSGRNRRCRSDQDISATNAKVKTVVVHAREDLAIASECLSAIK